MPLPWGRWEKYILRKDLNPPPREGVQYHSKLLQLIQHNQNHSSLNSLAPGTGISVPLPLPTLNFVLTTELIAFVDEKRGHKLHLPSSGEDFMTGLTNPETKVNTWGDPNANIANSKQVMMGSHI